MIEEFLSLLCGLLFVLAVVAVVGHLLWLAGAWCWKVVTGQSARPTPAGGPCPSCGATNGVRDGRCMTCGLVPQIRPGGTLREELKTTARQLRRFVDTGRITQEQYDSLLVPIQADLAQIEAGLGVSPFAAPRAMAPPVAAAAASPHAPSPSAPPSTPPAAPPPGTTDDLVEIFPATDEVVEAIVVDAPLVPAGPPPAVPPTRGRPPAYAAPGLAAATPVVPPPAAPPLPPATPLPPPPPSVPIRSWADVLQSFMEESNIRWGEILAALLIVLSSVGLVISLRNQLKAVPYFPAILFTLFTVAFHGAGLYTLRRWKIQAVSRVILIISLLLVPLAISGAVVMSGSGQSQRSASDPLFVVAVLLGAGIFGWVAFTASRELVGEGKWRLAAGVLGCSLSQVLIQRIDVATTGFWALQAIALVPLCSFLIATVGQLVRARRWPQLSRGRAGQIFLVLGISTFALLAALLLLLIRTHLSWQTIAWLSPAFSLAAASVMALGLLVHRRTTARDLALVRTAGTGVLLFAGALMLVLVAFAWPEPKLLLAVGVVNAIVLVALAIVSDLALLYAPAIACAALASLMGLHLVQGRFEGLAQPQLAARIVEALMMGRSGALLTILAAVTASAGLWCLERKRRDAALVVFGSTAALAAASVAIALFCGFVTVSGWQQDADLAAPLLATFALALIAAGPRLPWPAVPATGSALVWIAFVQALSANATLRGWLEASSWLPTRPVLAATLLHALAMACVCAAAARGRIMLSKVDIDRPEDVRLWRGLVTPLSWCAVVSLVALVPMLLWVPRGDFQWHAAASFAASLAWGLLLATRRWPWAFSALQAMLSLACGLCLAGLFHERLGDAWPLARPHVQAQLLAFALAAGGWSIARRFADKSDVLRGLANAPWPGIDQVLLVAAVVGLPAIEFIRTLPALGWELGFAIERPGWEFSKALVLSDDVRTALLTSAVFAALAAALWKRVSLEGLVGVGVASSALVWSFARLGEETHSAASAARWIAAALALGWALPYIFRDPLHAAARHLTWLRWDRLPRELSAWFCAQPLVLFGTPVLILTILAVEQGVRGVALRGPLAGSLFDQIGMTVSYAGPLLIVVGVLLAYAVRDRQAGFALGGSAVFQLAINLAFMLRMAHLPGLTVSDRAIEWLQWNSVAAGAFALIWLGLGRWISPAGAGGRLEPAFTPARVMLALQIAVAAITAAAVTVWAAVAVVHRPGFPPAEVVTLGSWLSYVAVLLVLAASVWLWWGRLPVALGDAVLMLAVACVALAACTADRFDPARQWLAYHVLTGGWIAAGLAAIAATSAYHWRAGGGSPPMTSPPSFNLSRLVPHHLSSAALAALLAALAIRGNRPDPDQPWWSLAATGAGFGIATALGLVRRSQLYAYASTALAGLAAILLWTAPRSRGWLILILGDDFLAPFTILLAILAAGGLWLACEIRSQQRQNASFSPSFLGPRVHASVICSALPVFSLLLLACLFRPLGLRGYEPVVGATALALGIFIAACLWDRRGYFAFPLAYLWLGCVWLMAVLCIPAAAFEIDALPARVVLLFAALALQVAATGQVWSYGANLAAIGTKVGVSDPIGGLSRTVLWLVPANLLLAAVVCALHLVFVLTIDSERLRVVAAIAPAVAAWGVLCLAQERRRDALQLAALLMAGLAVIYLGWAQIDPVHTQAIWLTRVFRLLMALAAITFAYGLLVPRFLLTTGSWNTATRRAGHIAGVAAVATLIAVLVLEIALFRPGVGAPVDGVQVAAVAVVLLALIAGLLSLALLPESVAGKLGVPAPGASPINPQFYVYAAEVVGVLLFAHLYVARPMWFDHGLRPYWPLIVMGIAFVGVGASELCQRMGIRVLAEPLQKTGALLPILPVLGIWIVAAPATDYALLLLVVGILYLVLSVTRKSFASLVAAAVAGNAALWVVLQQRDFSFAANPQFWLIPPALSALAAAQVNRSRLSPEALTGIRYAAAVVIYLSSTSEIFIRGVGDHLWPPMLLAGLAVAGAMLGIVLRIRAFLYLGTTFTLLALVTMVWHAARAIEHVWPWWAFGIGTGIAILVLFGIFEKKRSEVLALIARLRQWEQ